MAEHWETLDLYKALAAIFAGFVLGLERELKDKSAGLKTMTIICLGSALFSMISMKVGIGSHDPGRIAANIITGIGFLGAGVIFKEGFTVHGLTTAGIIWISSAIGMAIGYGMFYLALTCLSGSLVIIYGFKIVNSLLQKRLRNNKILFLKLNNLNGNEKEELLHHLASYTSKITETSLKRNNSLVCIRFEIRVTPKQNKSLEKYLLENKNLLSFTLQ